jgi:hypothetical protein
MTIQVIRMIVIIVAITTAMMMHAWITTILTATAAMVAIAMVMAFLIFNSKTIQL